MVPSTRDTAIFLLGVITVLTISHAHAWQIQTGNFIQSDTWVTSPTLGVSLLDTTHISVDRNGDGSHETTYDLPSEIQPDSDPAPQFRVSYRLSPTREILYSWRYNDNGIPAVCGGEAGNVQVFFHKLDDPPGTGMTNLIDLPGGFACMPGGVAIDPRFYDKHINDPIRTAVVVSNETTASWLQHVLWVDLKNGGAHVETLNPYESIVDEVEFAPSGNAAFIRHGLDHPTLGHYNKYSIIDLCDNPLGNTVSTRNHPPSASTAQVSGFVGDKVLIEVTADSYHEDFLLEDCTGGTPDLYSLTITPPSGGVVESNAPVVGGIFCLLGGDCEETYLAGQTVNLKAIPWSFGGWSFLFTGWTGDCSGTSPTIQVVMDADKTCSAAFAPPPSLKISITSPTPASVPRESDIEYILKYENGSAAVSHVVIKDTLPAGVSFVSASNGGTEAGGVVTWNLGGLPAAATGQVTLTVGTDCHTLAPVRNNSFSISSTETGLKAGTGSVETVFDAASTDPLTVDIASTPPRLPLRSGDVVTHEISLTHTGSQNHHCVSMGMTPGNFMDFGIILNDGGGVMEQPHLNSWTWRGTVNGGSSTTISFTTVVEDCLSPYFDETKLNDSLPIRVRNAQGVEVGSGMSPGPFKVQKPVTLSYEAINLGPIQEYGEDHYQVARPGQSVDFQIVLTNAFAEDQSLISIALQIPDGFTPIGDPPFIPPTDAAATYDGLNRRVSWSGPIPGNTSVPITYRAVLEQDASCRERNEASGAIGDCANLISSLVVLKAPEPPGTSYLTGLDGFNGLFTWTLGVDQGFQELFCFPAEFVSGLSRSEDGDYWVSGVPTFRFNPDTLDFFILDAIRDDFPEDTFLEDVAFDKSTDTMIFLGTRNDAGTRKSAIKRYDPGTKVTSDIIDDLPDLGKIVVNPDGIVAGIDALDLFRIDPADPASYVAYGVPTSLHFNERTLSLDRDGDFLVQCVEYSGFSPIREPVLKKNQTAGPGPFTEIVSDLAAVMQTPYYSFNTSVAGPEGEIYFGKTCGDDVAEVYRGGSAHGTFLSEWGTLPPQPSSGVTMGSLTALVYVDSCPQEVDVDKDKDLDGSDLRAFAADLSAGSAPIPMNVFARFFGRANCP